jgi:hypothetical protein
MACAAAVTLPTESVVFISMSCLKISCASALEAASPGLAGALPLGLALLGLALLGLTLLGLAPVALVGLCAAAYVAPPALSTVSSAARAREFRRLMDEFRMRLWA